MTAFASSTRRFAALAAGFFAHAAALVVGFVLMVVGLALGVTLIMLPAGVVIGLIGACIRAAVARVTSPGRFLFPRNG
jgi:hypothetical protein